MIVSPTGDTRHEQPNTLPHTFCCCVGSHGSTFSALWVAAGCSVCKSIDCAQHIAKKKQKPHTLCARPPQIIHESKDCKESR